MFASQPPTEYQLQLSISVNNTTGCCFLASACQNAAAFDGLCRSMLSQPFIRSATATHRFGRSPLFLSTGTTIICRSARQSIGGIAALVGTCCGNSLLLVVNCWNTSNVSMFVLRKRSDQCADDVATES